MKHWLVTERASSHQIRAPKIHLVAMTAIRVATCSPVGNQTYVKKKRQRVNKITNQPRFTANMTSNWSACLHIQHNTI